MATLYIVDLGSRELLALIYEPTRGGLNIQGRRDLVRDLGGQTEERGAGGRAGRRRY